ncbi:MAG: diguanylate cyclase [Bacillota bacterium]
MLKREYKISKELRGIKNIVEFYDLIEYQEKAGLVFEYIEGDLLNNIIVEQKITVEKFLDLAIKLVDVISKLHENNIIHCNFNSSAILVNQVENELKLIDLKTALPENQLKNETILINSNLFDLAYIAPEATGKINQTVNYRSDFYSLGIVFYELLTGELPFKTEDETELLYFHLAKEPPSPVEVNPKVPKTIAEIVLKLMNKNPEDRYQSLAAVEHDLIKCQGMKVNEGRIAPFIVAQSDVSNKLKIPEKLYGRKKEASKLDAIYNNLDQQRAQLVMIEGDAGIGKSALIQDFRTKVECSFVSGKYEQLQGNNPYAAFVDACTKLVRNILTKSEAKIDRWKERILKAVGNKGGLIIDFIPELELIIGAQPSLSELPLNNNKNIFNLVWSEFISAFINNKQPLIIFLDDLQWIDLSSLQLLKGILYDYQLENLLIVGAYRDNKISEGHPLKFSLEEQFKNDAISEIIYLEPLNLQPIIQLLAETLDSSREEVYSLAEICLNKTGGNPFFLQMFLYSLQEQGLITYSFQANKWQWEIEKIAKLHVTDNVVDLLLTKLNDLSSEKQQVLKLASCIGNKFKLKTLAIILQKPVGNIIDLLWELISARLIIGEHDFKGQANLGDEVFSFAHDKIQQAAYQMIEDNNRAKVHWKIGNLMLEQLSPSEKKDKIFEIVKHLNQGQSIIDSEAKKKIVIKLNLQAGEKAVTAVAYETAFKYFNSGLDLLAQDWWQKYYDLTLDLHLKSAEAAYLKGDFNAASTLLETLFGNVSNLTDKMKAYDIKIKALEKEKKHLAAIETGLEALDLLGLSLSTNPAANDFTEHFKKVREFVNNNSVKEIINRAELTEEAAEFKLRFLRTISGSAYLAAPKLFPIFIVNMATLTIDKGNSSFAPIAYSFLGAAACGKGQFKFANKLGEISLALLDRIENKNIKTIEPTVLYVVYQFIFFWTKAVRKMIEPLKDVYQVALTRGNYEAAGKAAYRAALRDFLVGEPLSELEQELGEYRKILNRIKQYVPLNFIKILEQVVFNLRAKNEQPIQLLGPIYDQRTTLEENIEANDNYSVCSVYLYKIIICYLLDEQEQAQENLAQAKKYAPAISGDPAEVLLNFYSGLVQLTGYNQIPAAKQEQVLEDVREIKDKFKNWAQYCESNFLNKYYLLEAEYCRISGQDIEAIQNYKLAIKEAKKNNYVNDQALANELAAEFWFDKNDNYAHLHLKKAYDCYKSWGVKVKVKELEQKHPNILKGYRHSKAELDYNLIKRLDIKAILEANQAFADKIVLEELIKKIIKIVAENAGAQKIAFIMNEEGLIIRGKRQVEKGEVELTEEAVAKSNYVPQSIINYASRTKENVVLNDATQAEKFKDDEYIAKYQPCSIITIALVAKGELEGLIYLENNYIRGAFTKKRVKILEMLSVQMAISLRNASLYRELEQSEAKLKKHKQELEKVVAERTKELAKKNRKLKEVNLKLENLSFLDGLTGIPNRRRFDEKLAEEWRSALRNKTSLSIVMLDIDKFKDYNDYYGHLAGDDCIKKVANVLTGSAVRPRDFPSRYGGEEFMVILPETDLEGAKKVAERIRKEVEVLAIAHECSDVSDYVTVSLGIAAVKPYYSQASESEFVDTVDKALYQAKTAGRNQVQAITLFE